MAKNFDTFPRTNSSSTSTMSSTALLQMSWTSWALATIALYAFVVRAFRYRRVGSMIKHYGYTTREKLAMMTEQEAFEIVKQFSEYEFPDFFTRGLQLALFRTYGIPSISKLLVQTAQLSKDTNVAKRYADTVVITSEMYANSPSSERATDSYARLNYLHGTYIKSGKIANADMLYTLALFMTHPVEWINKNEWRQLTELEVCATAVFHKSMGDAMEISFEQLPGTKHGFRDGLQFYEELDTWAKQYEQQFMLPHKDNYNTAIQTRKLLLATLPKSTHGLVTNLVHAAMDRQLRHAVMFEDPDPMYHQILGAIFVLRKNFLRYLTLPRMNKNPIVVEQASESGRRHFSRYETFPVYVKPTLWNRWGPGSWMSRYLGVPLPGDAGMYPEGFKIQECGPRAFLGKGSKEFNATKEKLKTRSERTGGCPFIIVK